MMFRCRVVRKQVWSFDVEADDYETAKDKADQMACHEEAHDDYAYETTADELVGYETDAAGTFKG
jgi:hypothetical protein